MEGGLLKGKRWRGGGGGLKRVGVTGSARWGYRGGIGRGWWRVLKGGTEGGRGSEGG